MILNLYKRLFLARAISQLCLVLLLLAGSYIHAAPALEIVNLRTEYKINPVGIDIIKPRLSWEIFSNKRGVKQIAYQIRVAAKEQDIIKGDDLMWDSGKIDSDISIHVTYDGRSLKSGQRVFWKVRIWNQDNEPSDWSESGLWEMGLLKSSDWQASWIQAEIEENFENTNPVQMFRKEFELKDEIKSARIYVTCLGLYEMEINGKKVGDEVFTPGWTSYNRRLQYQTYDVTNMLKPGKNAIGIQVGDGWYRGWFGFQNQKNIYGKYLALLTQLNVTYSNGGNEKILTDKSWKMSTGPILMSHIYDGEVYDARLEKEGWSSAGYDDSDWFGVKLNKQSKEILIAPQGPPVRKMEEIKPVNIFRSPQEKIIVDMGQNMVGWVRLKVKGDKGTEVTLKHSEVLDKYGNFYVDNLRLAKQTTKYVLKGSGIEYFEPHFTFQGFRYVQVEGYPGELTPESLTGVVIYSDIQPMGNFECSDPMINQLQKNIQWGQKGNFLDVPTDCPQRDERMGWTGDAQAFARTACFNADVAAFYTKWMKDFIADQQPKGQIPHVIPNVLSHDRDDGGSASAGWADAAVIVPWTVYLCYGDIRILEEQYQCMKGWVDYMKNRAADTYFWNTDFTFGDWLAFNTTRSDYPGATTDKDFISQAYFYRSTQLFQKIAKLLGKTEDAQKYSELLVQIKKVFNNEFVTANGRLSPNTQTAYTLALGFDLLSESMREKAAQRLASDVNNFKHITTGFLGTPLICHVLSDYGYYDEAFMLLNRQKYPSWLYPITMGATTIWERWDGIKPDSTFQDKGMNSFNHYAYGAIGDWLYRVVAGIEIDENNPAYKHIIIQPHLGGGLTSAKASVNSMYGNIVSSWEISDDVINCFVEIPANTSATVFLPEAKLEDVKESGKSLDNIEGIIAVTQEENRISLMIGSGKYHFIYPLTN